MSQVYKIEVSETLTENVFIEAESEEEALDIIKKIDLYEGINLEQAKDLTFMVCKDENGKPVSCIEDDYRHYEVYDKGYADQLR